MKKSGEIPDLVLVSDHQYDLYKQLNLSLKNQ